jgi:hypothetical protein
VSVFVIFVVALQLESIVTTSPKTAKFFMII